MNLFKKKTSKQKKNIFQNVREIMKKLNTLLKTWSRTEESISRSPTSKFRNKKILKDRPVRIVVPNFQNTVGLNLMGE